MDKKLSNKIFKVDCSASEKLTPLFYRLFSNYYILLVSDQKITRL